MSELYRALISATPAEFTQDEVVWLDDEPAAQPQPDAGRVQGEVTAAVERAGRAIWEHDNGHTTWPPRDPFEIGPAEDAARAGLAAALDVEEMARVIAAHQRVVGPHGLTRTCTCGVSLGPVGNLAAHQARALRVAILGGAW